MAYPMESRPSKHLLDAFQAARESSPSLRAIDPSLVFLPSPVQTAPATPDLGPADSPPCTRPKLLVMKFGGSSLATAEHLKRVVEIVRMRLSRRPIVVLSAMGKTTNDLLASAAQALEHGKVDIGKVRFTHEAALKQLGIAKTAEMDSLFEDLSRVLSGIALLKEVSARSRDLVVSFGERLCVRVFAAVYNHIVGESASAHARAIDSWEAGMLTTSGGGSANSAFSQCEIVHETTIRLRVFFGRYRDEYTEVPVVTGYIAKDSHGVVTTLGRDGSDLTATVIGAAVSASEVQIWKDVPGVMTTDPRVVPEALPVDLLTFEEAAELTTFGAKVVHPAAVLPAWLAKPPVPICVLNSTSDDPAQKGTRIVAKRAEHEESAAPVVAMSNKHDITMIVIRSTRMLGQFGFLAHVFQVFKDFEVSIDVIATSEVSVSLTLDMGFKEVDFEGLKRELGKVAEVEVHSGMGMVTLITERKKSTAVLRTAFQVFEDEGVAVEMVSHGASNVNVTFVVQDSSLSRCTKALHRRFFERQGDESEADATKRRELRVHPTR